MAEPKQAKNPLPDKPAKIILDKTDPALESHSQDADRHHKIDHQKSGK